MKAWKHATILNIYIYHVIMESLGHIIRSSLWDSYRWEYFIWFIAKKCFFSFKGIHFLETIIIVCWTEKLNIHLFLVLWFGCIVIAYWNIRLNLCHSPSLYLLYNINLCSVTMKTNTLKFCFVNNAMTSFYPERFQNSIMVIW